MAPDKVTRAAQQLRDAQGVGRAKHEVRALMLLIALGRFPRPSAVNATSPFRRSPSVAILADMDDLGRLYDASSGLRQFLDDHCRDLGARARKDALLLVVAKRLSRLTRGSGSSGAVIDHALGDANRASDAQHIHFVSQLIRGIKDDAPWPEEATGRPGGEALPRRHRLELALRNRRRQARLPRARLDGRLRLLLKGARLRHLPHHHLEPRAAVE